MNNWWFRTKPRSILKTLEWLKAFNALAGQAWDLKSTRYTSAFTGKPVLTTRRMYLYNVHKESYLNKGIELEDFLSGRLDENDVESSARNDKTTYEFYGLAYVDSKGIIQRTRAGQAIENGLFDENLLIKQLVKLEFEGLFPLELILHLYQHFNDLQGQEAEFNRLELGFTFMCMDLNQIDHLYQAILTFRNAYQTLDLKTDKKAVQAIFDQVKSDYFPNVTNKSETFYKDYADALIRTLEFTGLFASRGRGDYVKLFIPQHARLKVKMLYEDFRFESFDHSDIDAYMAWFGNPYTVSLPWESDDHIDKVVLEKSLILEEKLSEAMSSIPNFAVSQVYEEVNQLIKAGHAIEGSLEDKKILDQKLSNMLLVLNEKLFVEVTSKRDEIRREICDKFEDILSGTEDQAALWLEVNTWRSIVAMDGTQVVKRNFKIEEDLSPRAFAIGMGNTPDMEVYHDSGILIPEVSLMSGVRQWEHEGSAVIDHVLKFIETYGDKDVYGIFVSKYTNIRTLWQFFILSKTSWVGKAVPVLPLTIKQYVCLINHIYANEKSYDDFINLIEDIFKASKAIDHYRDWETYIENSIKTFCS